MFDNRIINWPKGRGGHGLPEKLGFTPIQTCLKKKSDYSTRHTKIKINQNKKGNNQNK